MTSSRSSANGLEARDIDRLSAGGWLVASASPAEVAAALDAAMAQGAGAMVRTCQRIEVYTLVEGPVHAPAHWHGFEALVHLAEVAAGLHSVVLGEREVLGQIRAALALAPPGVRRLGDVALASARELRRAERLAGDTGSLLTLGLSAADALPRGRALVLGGGVLAVAVARAARHAGMEVTLAIRDRSRGDRVFEAATIALAESASLGPVDVIAGCLGNGDAAVDLPPLPRAPVYLDLATPRNFPRVPNGSRLVTIAGLMGAEPPDVAERRGRLKQRIGEILSRRLEDAAHTRGSPIGQLRLQVEHQRAREAERIRRLHPEIPASTVEVITQSMVNRLFHGPSLRLKSGDDDEFSRRVAALFEPEEGVAP